MTSTIKIILITLLSLIFLCSSSAIAKKGKGHHGKSKGHYGTLCKPDPPPDPPPPDPPKPPPPKDPKPKPKPRGDTDPTPKAEPSNVGDRNSSGVDNPCDNIVWPYRSNHCIGR